MKLNAIEVGMVLEAVRSQIQTIESFLADADEGDDLESVQGDLTAFIELEAKLKAA